MAVSGEKIHAPTARRLEAARRAGQFPTSRLLATGLALLAGYLVLAQTAPAALGAWVLFLRRAFDGVAHATAPSAVIVEAGKTAFAMLALPLVALCATACLVGLAQSRGSWWPAGRSGRSLSRVLVGERMADTGRGIAVSLVLALALLSIAGSTAASLPTLQGANAARVLKAVGVLGRYVWLRLAIVTFALGLADYLWQRHAHAKALRMSPDELKREQRETEGEPLAKAERRRLYAESAAEVRDVANATLVVTGGAVAVAVHYDGVHAPYVTAKAQGQRAAQVLATARANAIAVSENPDIALALFATRSNEVPSNLYDRLAELFVEAGVDAGSVRGRDSVSSEQS